MQRSGPTGKSANMVSQSTVHKQPVKTTLLIAAELSYRSSQSREVRKHFTIYTKRHYGLHHCCLGSYQLADTPALG